MTDFGLFAERDIARANQKLDQLKRHAERRDRFIDALDLDALDAKTAFAILQEDDDLAENIAFGELYIHHIATLETQRAEIAASIPLAA
ncbi:hypothetical protein [Croceicoccus mobilis]|uniref:Uncharacterized protein n=1 Tax=Croceicoccus mobilis TaxID=1703339 RepID=A0A916Z9G1_9SPHN|nr:hypothetical protein [Croceicoccus mobilis]GGD81857.1 hypothetical protein GCM10010990_34750 [Croceicoccus mobilis]